MTEQAAAPVKLIFKAELLDMLGVSYGSIHAWMRAGKFPLAREIGPGGQTTRIAWREDEVMAWLDARPQRKIKPLPVEQSPKKKSRKK